jgi:steroid 5-alpha reductase family enzyme
MHFRVSHQIPRWRRDGSRRPRVGTWADGCVDLANLKAVMRNSAILVTALQTATASVALRRGRRDYADAIWGPGIAAVALAGALRGCGEPRRRWALAVITTLWAARLEHQMLMRLRGSDKEDSRYSEFLEDDGVGTVIVKVFVTQGVSQLIVAAPLQLAAASRLPVGERRHLVPAGLGIMVTGAVVEALADRQKASYAQRDDDEKPDVLDSGLWGRSRHPNYLGDSLVWDGAWLAAAASAPGAWTFPAPVLMTSLLMFATGARRTERRMQNRPGYRRYQQRVPFFFPLTRVQPASAGSVSGSGSELIGG